MQATQAGYGSGAAKGEDALARGRGGPCDSPASGLWPWLQTTLSHQRIGPVRSNLCLSVCLSASLSVYVSQSICVSLCLSVYPSVTTSLCASICFSLSINTSTSNTYLVLLGQQPSDLSIALGEIGPGQGLPVLAAVDLDGQMSDGHGYIGQNALSDKLG